MGRTGRARAPQGGGEPEDGHFPLVVTALSTGAALLLFFTTTVPALGEHRHLQDTALDHVHRAETDRAALERETRRRAALQIDPQAILVELDRRGIRATAMAEEPAEDAAAGDGR